MFLNPSIATFLASSSPLLNSTFLVNPPNLVIPNCSNKPSNKPLDIAMLIFSCSVRFLAFSSLSNSDFLSAAKAIPPPMVEPTAPIPAAFPIIKLMVVGALSNTAPEIAPIAFEYSPLEI